jgi:hypothetical protein
VRRYLARGDSTEQASRLSRHFAPMALIWRSASAREG